MRLCFCTELVDEPHLLILDESSNHLDLETLDSLAVALRKFEGAVVMISHNQGFLRMLANTLWICENGSVQALYSSEESVNDVGGNATSDGTTNLTTFDDLFGHYRSEVTTQSAASGSSQARKQRMTMAKKASQQSSGATTRSGLL